MVKRSSIHLVTIAFVFSLALLCAASAKQKAVDMPDDRVALLEQQIIKSLGSHTQNGTNYAVFTVLAQRHNGNSEAVYLIARTGEFIKQEGQYVEQSGCISPLVVCFENGNIVSSKAPGVGDLYAQDVKRLFPGHLQQQVLKSSRFYPELKTMIKTKVASKQGVPEQAVRLSSDP